MTEHFLIGVASIIILGIVAQWLAWRLHLPAILLLLVFGFAAGPATGFIDPNELFGDLLLPVVSVSVAVILFEGGLSLRFAELRETGSIVRNLISVGTLVTWIMITGAAYFILKLDFPLAVLLGAILVVTGPTVIVPLLRHVKPVGRIGSIVKWEGIVIDPIGAILAVLVFEAIIAGGVERATTVTIVVLKAILIGSLIGLLGAEIIILLLKRHWIPDFLQNPVSLMIVVAVFTASNLLQTESGLLAVTLMGIILANQRWVNVKHIIEFKENLRVLLISGLFITLAARLTIRDLTYIINLTSLVFLGILILLVRPLAVFLSTLRAKLNWPDKIFLSWMAPRGIVAAAVSSVFALRLVEAGYLQADLLVSLTFLVITGTVAIYGLTASPIARWLGTAKPHPQGVLIVGAHNWARAIAKILHNEGFQVLLVDFNWENISAARGEGLRTYYANVLSEYILDEIELDGIGRLLSLTSNDEVNSLAALHFEDIFGRSEVYQLSQETRSKNGKEEGIPQHLRGRLLFGPDITYSYLAKRFNSGAVIKKTPLTDEFDYKSFRSLYGDTAIPLFLVKETGDLVVFATDNPPSPQPGHYLISLVDDVKRK